MPTNLHKLKLSGHRSAVLALPDRDADREPSSARAPALGRNDRHRPDRALTAMTSTRRRRPGQRHRKRRSPISGLPDRPQLRIRAGGLIVIDFIDMDDAHQRGGSRNDQGSARACRSGASRAGLLNYALSRVPARRSTQSSAALRQPWPHPQRQSLSRRRCAWSRNCDEDAPARCSCERRRRA